ncbi:Smc5-6 complex non-SMC delta-kleisin subunit Nse4 [Schizosaccharomyces pombe]|uniref:Non-structural maintenance of chromosome element 4 n=1 Tax=Schizosaccharomyces pombe (strain 972 / ATCC 24843) TaxID=284812 RepID=NSE4_SCHPO|nr:non-structural maintenance of chromosome element 4 [Schizosaccharomyces pombe]Q6BDR8.1 RecName: Full=Non-structural maintenance of chromosome element 4; Short=Non-SMC element 4; AltName: Full=DNA repair protein rad62 [Schizosaccharomyces pombe 972h-]BAD34600.1 DNA repair protein Rad62 [Schizosaccharomyces pombe]CAH17526.1 Smc5-6 complex non-SMC subunit Nse4 [Schizosaccharomyces pombe]|eukprot:NP_001018837.1 non-structural maintenance of chromosome element 4 [Schizosaccharomyces pombe]
MSSIDKRDLRKRYRNLINKVQESRLELVDEENNNLYETITTANDLFSSVDAPTEATLDALLLTKTVDLASIKARQLHIGRPKFNIELFTKNIKQFLNYPTSHSNVTRIQEIDTAWSRLGKLASNCEKQPASLNLMVGPLSFRKKERNIQRRERLQKAPNVLTQPTMLNERNITTQENNTTKNVLHISRLLQAHQPVNFLKFITNPQSYPQTVENLFYVSFLFKEGKAALVENESGILMLETRIPPTDDQVVAGEIRNIQLVLDMTMDLYENIIKEYNIKESIIPTRAPVETSTNSNTWYG